MSSWLFQKLNNSIINLYYYLFLTKALNSIMPIQHCGGKYLATGFPSVVWSIISTYINDVTSVSDVTSLWKWIIIFE